MGNEQVHDLHGRQPQASMGEGMKKIDEENTFYNDPALIECRAALASLDAPQGEGRFARLSPDAPAQIPEGYSAPLDMRTTRQLIAERERSAPAPAPDALREAGEALEPFDFYDFAPEDGWSDTDELEVHAPDGILIHCLKVGDIRRATAALARLKEGDSGATDHQPRPRLPSEGQGRRRHEDAEANRKGGKGGET